MYTLTHAGYFAIVFCLLEGFIVGIFPAAVGIYKGRYGISIISFVSCGLAAFISGFITAMPVALLFIFVLLRKHTQEVQKEEI